MNPTVVITVLPEDDHYWSLSISVACGPMQYEITIDEPYLCRLAEWYEFNVPYFRLKRGETNLLIIEVDSRDGMGEESHTRLTVPADILRSEMVKALDSAKAQGLQFAD